MAGGRFYTAAGPCSPVRMRITSSTGSTQILPSPTAPVRAALQMMNLSSPSDVTGEPVVRVLDPGDFFTVLESGQSIEKKRIYLSEYDRYAEETIIPDHEFHQIICILRDVTEEERVRRQKEELSRQTAEIADGVVAKQMRIVQEIASLLGETAAETKIALYKLKGSVSDE